MNHKLNKELVRQRFARGLHSYVENAHIQRECAERLIFELSAVAGTEYDQVFEFGAGAALLTEMIAESLQYNKLLVNDLAPEAREYVTAVAECEFIPGDVEHLDAVPRELDLIIGNAAFQWLQEPAAALRRFAEHLKIGGILAFSTFGPRNLEEISDLTGVSLNYLQSAELRKYLWEHFEILCFHENVHHLEFADPRAVLRHLKDTGATGVDGQIWTKSTIQDFETTYQERYSYGNGVRVSYHPVVVIAKRLKD
jgi:malonyl-CoA O-methyltransferase